MILCKEKSFHISNSAINIHTKQPIHTGGLFLHRNSYHLETSGNRSRQTKDDARRIGDYKRPVTMLFEKSVSNPHRAVDECDERLNPVSLMTGQISKDLRNIGNVHIYSEQFSLGDTP